MHLPAAFRSLSRLSSVLGAKAFTLRSSLLDLLSLNHKDLSLILHFQQNCLFNKIVDFSIRLSLYLSSLSIFRFSYIFCSIIQFSRCSLTKVTVVGSNGLEPSTSRLSGARSNHLSYRPFLIWLRFDPSGGDDGNRTHDPLLAGQVLSQLSYTPMGSSIPEN